MAATRPSIMSEGATTSAPARMGDRRGRQPFQRLVVIYVSIHDLAAVTVAGVLAVADVGHHQQPRSLFPDGAYGALHDAVVGVCPGGHLVLALGQSEQDHAADAQSLDLRALLDQFVNRHLVVARHGADLLADPFAGANKKRQNELPRVEARLPHQVSEGLCCAQPARPVNRKRHLLRIVTQSRQPTRWWGSRPAAREYPQKIHFRGLDKPTGMARIKPILLYAGCL